MRCKTFDIRRGIKSSNEDVVNKWLDRLQENGVYINVLHTNVVNMSTGGVFFAQLFVFYEVKDHGASEREKLDG